MQEIIIDRGDVKYTVLLDQHYYTSIPKCDIRVEHEGYTTYAETSRRIKDNKIVWLEDDECRVPKEDQEYINKYLSLIAFS